MRKQLLLIIAFVMAMLCQAQVPQFSSSSFEGWGYNNPNVVLSADNILRDNIALYVTSTGLPLTLTSPPFSCQRGMTIDMNVQWNTPQWQNEGFQVSRVALTAALIDDAGVTVDSVTCIPDPVSRTNYLDMSLIVSRSITNARLRFVAWKSVVSNCGRIRKIQAASYNKADVNLDGEVSIADVNAIINVILDKTDDADLIKRADVNEDKEVTISDINRVIGIILS